MAGPLSLFAPLLGQCFAAHLAADTVDRHCFARVYDGAHVRDTHVVTVKGKPVYSGETVYSAVSGGLSFTYFNSTGGSGAGSASVKGSTLSYQMTMRASPDKQPAKFVGRWIVEPDGYRAESDGQPPRRFTRVR